MVISTKVWSELNISFLVSSRCGLLFPLNPSVQEAEYDLLVGSLQGHILQNRINTVLICWSLLFKFIFTQIKALINLYKKSQKKYRNLLQIMVSCESFYEFAIPRVNIRRLWNRFSSNRYNECSSTRYCFGNWFVSLRTSLTNTASCTVRTASFPTNGFLPFYKC